MCKVHVNEKVLPCWRRLGRFKASSSPSEGRRLPLPALVIQALSRGADTHPAEGAPPTPRRSGSGSGGGGGSGNGPITSRPSSSELLHGTEEPSASRWEGGREAFFIRRGLGGIHGVCWESSPSESCFTPCQNGVSCRFVLGSEGSGIDDVGVTTRSAAGVLMFERAP